MAGQGSSLVLHHLRQNYADFFIDGLRVKPVEGRALNLLLAGVGTLRRMDYPSFSLVSPAFTIRYGAGSHPIE